jgi:hypothetical protein
VRLGVQTLQALKRLNGGLPLVSGRQLSAAQPMSGAVDVDGNGGEGGDFSGLPLGSHRQLSAVQPMSGGGGRNGGVSVPRYDKTLRGGRGDRAPVSDWLTVRAPLDVILLEARRGPTPHALKSKLRTLNRKP